MLKRHPYPSIPTGAGQVVTSNWPSMDLPMIAELDYDVLSTDSTLSEGVVSSVAYLTEPAVLFPLTRFVGPVVSPASH